MSWWMRCFISIDLPEDVKKELVKLQKKIDETGLIRGKLTEEENIHLTLKFLGEIDYDKIEEVKRRLKEIQLEKREAKLGELGVFSESYVRIIWVRLEGVDDLQKAVDSALEGVFKKEERFMSHITIARVKSVKDKKELLHILEKQSVEGKFIVDSFSLRSSELSPEGPKYTDLERYDLR